MSTSDLNFDCRFSTAPLSQSKKAYCKVGVPTLAVSKCFPISEDKWYSRYPSSEAGLPVTELKLTLIGGEASVIIGGEGEIFDPLSIPILGAVCEIID